MNQLSLMARRPTTPIMSSSVTSPCCSMYRTFRRTNTLNTWPVTCAIFGECVNMCTCVTPTWSRQENEKENACFTYKLDKNRNKFGVVRLIFKYLTDRLYPFIIHDLYMWVIKRLDVWLLSHQQLDGLQTKSYSYVCLRSCTSSVILVFLWFLQVN